jgi:hypothetical protein
LVSVEVATMNPDNPQVMSDDCLEDALGQLHGYEVVSHLEWTGQSLDGHVLLHVVGDIRSAQILLTGGTDDERRELVAALNAVDA